MSVDDCAKARDAIKATVMALARGMIKAMLDAMTAAEIPADVIVIALQDAARALYRRN